MALLFCMCVLLMENAHVCFADNLTLMEAYFTNPEGYSGMVEVPGKGMMRYYAQNDPLWGALCYEKEDVQGRRPFRDSGCCPTAAAMAVAALVPTEELSRVSGYAKKPFSLCSCSLNQGKCNRRHSRYYLTSDRDFERFLPLVFGAYAAGNNMNGTYSRSIIIGTSTSFLKEIAAIYGLRLRVTDNYSEAVDAMKRGAAVMAHSGKGGCFTDTGHYIFLAHIDDERLYILDPLCREVYKTNQAKKLEIIQPGLVALTHENVRAAQLTSFLIFEKAEP